MQLDFILKVKDKNPNVCKCEIILFKKLFQFTHSCL